MTTNELAAHLRGVVIALAQAAEALLAGELADYKVKYAEAMRRLDMYEDQQDSIVG